METEIKLRIQKNTEIVYSIDSIEHDAINTVVVTDWMIGAVKCHDYAFRNADDQFAPMTPLNEDIQ